MGNWNRRYIPRNKYRNNYDDFEDPINNNNNNNNNNNSNNSSSYGIEENRVPSWEIDYCNSARVPWRKVLASKKYIYCYPNVLNWDASAGKEALQNAKQRYWAMINGLPCDDPLPDPDMYVDEIDWDPYMDPELMTDLDRQHFDPDKVQNVEKLESNDEGIECAQAKYDNNQTTNDNPWEKDNVQTTSLKDAVQGWSRWDDSINLNNDNPWEKSCSHLVDSSKDNVWRSGNESWGWEQGIDKSSAFVNNGQGNTCNYIRQEGWVRRENNSRDWNRGNANAEGFRNFSNSGYSRENNYSTGGSKERGWRNNGNESWSRRESDYQDNEPKYLDSRGFRGGGSFYRGGCRKREGFQQHGSKYKSSRYHGDTYGDNRQL